MKMHYHKNVNQVAKNKLYAAKNIPFCFIKYLIYRCVLI